jgi:hypothetical protein
MYKFIKVIMIYVIYPQSIAQYMHLRVLLPWDI